MPIKSVFESFDHKAAWNNWRSFLLPLFSELFARTNHVFVVLDLALLQMEPVCLHINLLSAFHTLSETTHFEMFIHVTLLDLKATILTNNNLQPTKMFFMLFSRLSMFLKTKWTIFVMPLLFWSWYFTPRMIWTKTIYVFLSAITLMSLSRIHFFLAPTTFPIFFSQLMNGIVRLPNWLDSLIDKLSQVNQVPFGHQ